MDVLTGLTDTQVAELNEIKSAGRLDDLLEIIRGMKTYGWNDDIEAGAHVFGIHIRQFANCEARRIATWMAPEHNVEITVDKNKNYDVVYINGYRAFAYRHDTKTPSCFVFEKDENDKALPWNKCKTYDVKNVYSAAKEMYALAYAIINSTQELKPVIITYEKYSTMNNAEQHKIMKLRERAYEY